jgi:hypothetical protein
MFGQHDDHKQDQTNDVTPTDDAALTAAASLAAPDDDDSTTTSSPVADTPLPTPEPTTTTEPGFIATDQNGAPDPVATADLPQGASDLLEIKKNALQQLSPLVGHLNQTPEEKFRTAMMMIQASDDQTLIPAAYEAAKEITDEKTRAQALLDIVNEINYFTQQHDA